MTTIDDARSGVPASDTPWEVGTAAVPVVSGFHPDPTICRAGDDYYLAHSSFEYAPAVPLWHSRDLLTWELIGNVLDRADQFVPGSSADSQGIFAPTLRFHAGRFWLITTDVAEAGGQILVSTTDPRGPWSTPVRIPGLIGIDPDLAWDESGCIVTYRSTDPNLTGIAQARVDLETGQLREEPRLLWQGIGLAFPEAPHLFQRGHWWYLMIAEGGTERGHCVSIARSARPEGPFEGNPANPILTHRSTDLAVQNTGHADLVEGADGSWSMVYLGVRPRGVTPFFHVLGRETFLAGIDWIDDWPRVDEGRYRRRLPSTSFTDRFDGEERHPRWVSPGASVDVIAHPLPRGGLEMVAVEAPGVQAGALVTRIRDLSWRFEAELVPGEGAIAVMVRLDGRHACEVLVRSHIAVAGVRIGGIDSPADDVLIESAHPAITVYAESLPSLTNGPDDVVMGIVQDGTDRQLLRLDGRYLSTEVAGGFTGRVIGVRPARGRSVVREVRYTGRDAGEKQQWV